MQFHPILCKATPIDGTYKCLSDKMRRRSKKSIFLGIFLGILWFIAIKHLKKSPRKEEKPVKYILFWTEYLERKNWIVDKVTANQKDLEKLGCQETSCIFTSNRSLIPIENFDAVLFSIFHKIKEVPQNRSPEQIYVAATGEAPIRFGDLLKPFDHFFNWTS